MSAVASVQANVNPLEGTLPTSPTNELFTIESGDNSYLIVKLKSFPSDRLSELKSALCQLAKQHSLVVDMSDVKAPPGGFMDALLAAHRERKDIGTGKNIVVCVPESIARVFAALGLDRVFTLVPSIAPYLKRQAA